MIINNSVNVLKPDIEKMKNCHLSGILLWQQYCNYSIVATTPGFIVRILNSVFFKFLNYSVNSTRYRPTP